MNNVNTSCLKPSLSIGVVTHDRAVSFAKLLCYLIPAIERYGHSCEVVVANNSGSVAHEHINSLIVDSGLRDVCECRLIDSKQNNISTGRNLILEHAREDHLVFIDDDEYPISTWLVAMVDTMRKLDCSLVAGPIIPVFPSAARGWARYVDLHNSAGLETGDQIDYAASGNFLMNRNEFRSLRFGESLGKSGGEDTAFFLQLKDKGHQLYWCGEGVVYEDIPASKSTEKYMIHRFMTQGRNYRTIKEERGEISNLTVFILRASLLASISVAIAHLLSRVSPSSAARWMKRGYSNLGKFIEPGRDLYE